MSMQNPIEPSSKPRYEAVKRRMQIAFRHTDPSPLAVEHTVGLAVEAYYGNKAALGHFPDWLKQTLFNAFCDLGHSQAA